MRYVTEEEKDQQHAALDADYLEDYKDHERESKFNADSRNTMGLVVFLNVSWKNDTRPPNTDAYDDNIISIQSGVTGWFSDNLSEL